MRTFNFKVSLYLLLALFFYSACEKDQETIVPVISTYDEGLEKQGTTDVSEELLIPADQFFLDAFVEYLFSVVKSDPGYKWPGTPVVEWIITERCGDEVTALMPFVVENEVKFILYYYESAEGEFEYTVFNRDKIEENPESTLYLLTDEEEYEISGVELAYFFQKFDKQIFGKPLPGGDLSKGGGIWNWGIWPWNWGGPHCPSAAGGRKKPRFRTRPQSGSGTTDAGDPNDYETIWINGRGFFNGRGFRPDPSGQGSGPSITPPHLSKVLRLQSCEGYLDPYDTEDNPGAIHPDFEFCASWMPYRENCLENYASFDDMLELWGRLLHYHPNAFEQLTQSSNCNADAIATLIFTKLPGGFSFSTGELQVLLHNPDFAPLFQAFLAEDIHQHASRIGIVRQLLALDGLTAELIEQVLAFRATYYTVWGDPTVELLASGDVELIDQLTSIGLTLELDSEEIDLLIQQPDYVPPVQQLLATGNPPDNLPDLIHALLETVDGQPAADLLLVTQVVDFWNGEHQAGQADEMTEHLSYWLYARLFFPELEGFSTFEIDYENYDEEEDVSNTPFTTGEIWSKADDIRNDLLFTYGNDPIKVARIENFFVCQVLALAFEEVVLRSFGKENFDFFDTPIPGSGMTAEPDGYHALDVKWDYPFGPIVPNSHHVITEVKTKFTDPFIFDWSSNPSQYTQYLDFLSDNQYQGTAPNTLYLILPENVVVDEDIITTCTDRNILLVTSAMEISSWNSDLVRVTKPIAHNQWDLSYHPNQLETMAKLFPINGLYGPQGQFDYNYVSFEEALLEKAAAFESSYLMNNNDVSCPDE